MHLSGRALSVTRDVNPDGSGLARNGFENTVIIDVIVVCPLNEV